MREPLNRRPISNVSLAYGHKIRESAFAGEASGGRKVLEVGCGAGGCLSALHQAGFDVRGCDYSSELIEYGRSRGVPGLEVGPVDVIAKTNDKYDFDLLASCVRARWKAAADAAVHSTTAQARSDVC